VGHVLSARDLDQGGREAMVPDEGEGLEPIDRGDARARIAVGLGGDLGKRARCGGDAGPRRLRTSQTTGEIAPEREPIVEIVDRDDDRRKVGGRELRRELRPALG
jgi:hypothetical protein